MIKIAVIPGDGIGKEVVAEGLKVLRKIEELSNVKFDFQEYPFGAEHYLKTGETLPDWALEEFRHFDAIYFGAIGDPRVKPGILEHGILLKLRFSLDLYVNLRPVKLYHPKLTPLKGKEKIDMVFIRENTEGLYAGAGGFLRKGTPHEVAIQEMINTRFGVERTIRFAFEYAKTKGRKKVTLVDKANVLTYAHDLWQRVFKEVASEYQEIETDHYYVDAMAMKMIRSPEIFEVVVTPNMFGDILTDLGAEIVGGLGLAASGNINPRGVSMFEPVHGSAPDIAGKGIANPLAAILTAALMLEHLGLDREASLVEKAVAKTIEENKVTPDLGGELKTSEVGNEVVKNLEVLWDEGEES
ncbi:3-isopropylmalate dehydrogenase [Pyrococcus furiosus DSM 3638]|uniref:3-isopropylmalate dehydrogenase n=3 Tax=Pyrococcus furiosus TaxID=2261 RepID=A0A5C0XN81_PYRFU|nr:MULTISPECIES: 3-isopropylmalate dehydrogenase [Pyrococcus]AAL81064.1 3-isopropylmalate dehydrogenase 2 [Pyrococcus furiosus DSM 3638]AFN03733.1 3-isopropylmalate dehydrogenase [Pyrococcus furiosus COM1]MDK2869719.1 3-isopropylmalate dehydrogenase [Pyrococcus sp.]QEK78606.1 3-isopropylmalate dehydrogenase [Pyrococcus furiosus DSM 3638]